MENSTEKTVTELKPSPFYRGFTLGIAGFVLSMSAPLIGLILSIIAYRQSKESGYKNNLAKSGIIISIAIMILVVAYVALIVIAASYGLMTELPR